MRRTTNTVTEAANGHWPEILTQLGGIDPALLDGKPRACPICGEGDDRFTFDDKEGRGTWICRRCPARPGRAAGAGDGMDLLQAVTGWDYRRAAEEIERHLGLPPQATSNGHRPAPPARHLTPAPAAPAAPPVVPQGPIELLRLPKPATDVVGIDPSGPVVKAWDRKKRQEEYVEEAVYRYSPSQRSRRLMPVNGGSKRFFVQHMVGGDWKSGEGSDPWLLWRQAEAIAAARANPSSWLLETEGEKAAEIAREGGLAAISQPGHAHKVEQIQPRYAALKAAGVAGIVYLADEDEEGRRRAQGALETADAVGLPLVVLPAVEAWPKLPQGGSIDDAPGTPAERVAALEAVVSGVEPHEWGRIWRKWQKVMGVGVPEDEVHQKASQAEKPPYSELIGRALEAIKRKDQDDEMAARADLKYHFRVSDEQIDAELFKRHSADKVQAIEAAHESVRLADVEQLEYLLDGWAPRGDLALLYGPYGTGKTTLALAKLYAHAKGGNLLDRDTPCQPGRGLFIATDSGAPALKKAMADLGIDSESDPLLDPGNPEQRIWIWANEPKQGHKAWICTIHDVIRLEEFIKAKGITYVIIDSAKAVSAPAGWSYTSNESVKALLQYLREGIAQPTGCCIEFLSHDGTERGTHSGAKAWAEDPSMVVALEVAKDENGKRIGITARFRKDRAAAVDPCRSVTFNLQDGVLVAKEGTEVVGSCVEAILTILWEAHQRGIRSIKGSDLKAEALRRFNKSHRTVENTLGRITGSGKGPNPSAVIRPRRGCYAMAPAEIQRRQVSPNRGLPSSGGESIRSIAADGIYPPPIETPDGGIGGIETPHPLPPGESIGGVQVAVPASDLDTSPPDGGGPPPWLPKLLALREQFPAAAPYTLAIKLEGMGAPRVSAATAREALERFGSAA